MEFGLNWRLDTASVEELPWKGYEARRETSAVTGLPRIRYDHDVRTDTLVPWRDKYRPSLTEIKPKAYLVPMQWISVIERLRMSGVEMMPLPQDTTLLVEQDSIGDFTTVHMPYEGHYLHRDITASRRRKSKAVHAGDMLVPMGRTTDRYVMEALECRADDGFFAWNFFDGILQQKEWYDDYVFEDRAARMLERDPALQAEFETKRSAEPLFAKDAEAQLTWLYRRSPWMEPDFRNYPVLRVVE